MNKVARKEPAVGIGASISAVLFAIIGILRANGVIIPDDLASSLDALIYALCAIPAVAGFLTRFFVWAPANVEAVKVEEFQAGQASVTDPAEPARAPMRTKPPAGAGVARFTNVGH